MKFNPEESENQLLAEGDADFEVLKADDTESKSGNEMIQLLLKVWDSHGQQGNVFDYLLPKLAWKIKQFCQATGISLDKFNSGELTAADCLGKTGKAFIKTQKDKTGQYKDKTVITGYAVPEESMPNAEGKAEFKDDDIPF